MFATESRPSFTDQLTITYFVPVNVQHFIHVSVIFGILGVTAKIFTLQLSYKHFGKRNE